MAGKRRVFGAAFKAKVALAAAKGDRTTAQLASQFGIHTSQVTAWKKQLMGQLSELFADGQLASARDAAAVHQWFQQHYSPLMQLIPQAQQVAFATGVIERLAD